MVAKFWGSCLHNCCFVMSLFYQHHHTLFTSIVDSELSTSNTKLRRDHCNWSIQGCVNLIVALLLLMQQLKREETLWWMCSWAVFINFLTKMFSNAKAKTLEELQMTKKSQTAGVASWISFCWLMAHKKSCWQENCFKSFAFLKKEMQCHLPNVFLGTRLWKKRWTKESEMSNFMWKSVRSMFADKEMLGWPKRFPSEKAHLHKTNEHVQNETC